MFVDKGKLFINDEVVDEKFTNGPSNYKSQNLMCS